MGRPIDELITHVGEPDVKTSGAMVLQYMELSQKYGDYIAKSEYARYKGMFYASDGLQPYTIYYYDHPKLMQGGRLDGTINIAVDKAGIIRSYGTGTRSNCSKGQKLFYDWVNATVPSDCITSE